MNDTIVRIKLGVFDPPIIRWTFGLITRSSILVNNTDLLNCTISMLSRMIRVDPVKRVSNPDTAITDVSAHAALDIALAMRCIMKNSLKMKVILICTDFINCLYPTLCIMTFRLSLQVSTLWQEPTLSGTTDTLQVLDTITVEYFYSDLAQLDTPELQWMQYEEGTFAFSDFILEPDTYSGIRHK